MIQIRKFIIESRVHMAHLPDDEFYAKLPLAVIIYVTMEVRDWTRSKWEFLCRAVTGQ